MLVVKWGFGEIALLSEKPIRLDDMDYLDETADEANVNQGAFAGLINSENIR